MIGKILSWNVMGLNNSKKKEYYQRLSESMEIGFGLFSRIKTRLHK